METNLLISSSVTVEDLKDPILPPTFTGEVPVAIKPTGEASYSGLVSPEATLET